MPMKYDVVVVGAGNSGLTAACRCAMEGKKALLIEQHNLPGGCASSFCRGRFEFDPSVHEICDFGPDDNKGAVRLLLERLGVNVDWVTIEDCYRCITKYSDGTPMDVTMPSGRGPFIDKMEEYVPGSRESMNKLFDLMEEIQAALNYMTDGTPNDSKYMQQHFPNTLRTGAYPTNKVFRALKLPQKAIDILSTYWAYLGVDLDHDAFIHYANMVHMYVTRKAVIPRHTSHEISMEFINRFRELGGDVWYNCRAEKFLFDGDRISGVVTNMGTIECDYVLANINPDIIYGKMMPKELVPEREKKLSAARNEDYSARMFACYFGLNKPLEEIGIKDYTVFMPGSSDSVKEAASFERIDTNEYCIFLGYNIANPDFSPKGTGVVSFTSMYGKKDWSDLEIKDYNKMKEAIAKKFIETTKEKMGIDITPYIEEVEIATPWTFARYLGTPEGCTYGHKTKDWDAMMNRMMMIGEDYPIKGLKHIGAAASRGDGYSSTWIIGDMLAGIACGEMKEGGK